MLVVLVVALTVVGAGIVKKSKVAKSKAKSATVQRVQTKERIKARNEALRYISEAHRKATQGDYNGAISDCDKAVEIAPNEPITKSCKNRIDYLRRKAAK